MAQLGDASSSIPAPPVPPATTQNPPRSRRTHLSEQVCAALKALPKALKKKKNKELVERNAERALRRALNEAAPLTYASQDSDDESMITVSDDDVEMSPASALAKVLAKATPGTTRNLLRAIPGLSAKRKVEDDKAREAAKKMRVEIVVRAGMSLPVVFPEDLIDLHENNCYLPLSLFTATNLHFINTNSATIEKIRLNPKGGVKGTYVIDTETFQAQHLREDDMDRGQWLEAAHNYVGFMEFATGSAESKEVKRWDAHFGFFEGVENMEGNFPAISTTRRCAPA
ncbi:hypothetical protein GGX14DRAFT_408491 [Mycena pura]|uniref:Uncharacterized protein n=1 Tax=Mycena pura TaxID=153505 RepID=A0AAD6UMS1_9AGAR|nr:hypothetical protein GGX14DRAFT_408491 [Mycena pura]